MSTDKEIRQFIRDNMPQIKGNERFMAELVRQIELLPVPASLSGKTEEEIRTAMDLISAAARKIKRRNRIKAVSAAAVSACLLGVLLAAYYFLPGVRPFVQQHFALVALCAVAAVAALLAISFAAACRLYGKREFS